MSTTGMPSIKVMMTPFPYHISAQAALNDAQQLMHDKHIRHLIVTLNDGGYGLLSERDLQHHQRLYGSIIGERDLIVGDICVEQAVCADINDPVGQVLDAMVEQHLGSVVILRDGELAGIFTTTDACQQLAKCLRTLHPDTDTPDLIA